MGWRQNRTAHRRQDAPGPAAPATGRSAARTRAARPRFHRQRPARPSWMVTDRTVHEPPRRTRPDHPSRCGPGPPSPVRPEGRPPRWPAPPVPTWRTAVPRDRSCPNRLPPGPTQSAVRRYARPAGSYQADPAVLVSTMHRTPGQRPAPTRAPRLLPPESEPRRLPDSTLWHSDRGARWTCRPPVAPTHHRSPPTPDPTVADLAPTHLPKIQLRGRPRVCDGRRLEQYGRDLAGARLPRQSLLPTFDEVEDHGGEE